MLTCCKMCAVFKLRMMIPPITHTQSADWNKHVMERNSSFQFPREPRGSELVLLCFFFHFWEPKRLLRERNGWQAALALGRCWLSTLQEKQWLFSQQWLRKNTLAALCHVLAFSLIADCMVSGLFSCFKQPSKNERKTHLKYPATWTFMSKICINSELLT